MTESSAAVFVMFIVFLIVFFISWGLHVRIVSALALASVITLLITYILFPPLVITLNIKDVLISPAWTIVYLVFIVLLVFYVVIYTIYMAVYDTKWGERHPDKCFNQAYFDKMKEKGVIKESV